MSGALPKITVSMSRRTPRSPSLLPTPHSGLVEGPTAIRWAAGPRGAAADGLTFGLRTRPTCAVRGARGRDEGRPAFDIETADFGSVADMRLLPDFHLAGTGVNRELPSGSFFRRLRSSGDAKTFCERQVTWDLPADLGFTPIIPQTRTSRPHRDERLLIRFARTSVPPSCRISFRRIDVAVRSQR